MAMEMHVFSDRQLNSTAEWQRAVDQQGWPLKFSEEAVFDTARGFFPSKLKGEPTGFECYHDDAQKMMQSYGRDHFHNNWKYALGFRWRGNFAELQTAWIAAAAYARATSGVVFDPEAGRSYTPSQAERVIRDFVDHSADIEAVARQVAVEMLAKRVK